MLKRRPSKPEWKDGDVILIGSRDASLSVLIDKHVAEGWITRIDRIGCFTGYTVHEIHYLP